MLCLKLLCAFFLVDIASGSDFDVAVTTGNAIHYYRKNGTQIESRAYPECDLSVLAYDDTFDTLFVVDEHDPHDAIFRLRDDEKVPVVRKQTVKGVSFDPVTRTLFWIGDGHIRSMNLSDPRSNGYGDTLVARPPDHGEYTDIAVDSCGGYIYWGEFALAKSKIHRCRFDGSERSVFINSNLYQPISLAIDHNTRRLYWADDSEGIHYKIESVNLDDEPKVIPHANKLGMAGIAIAPQHIAVDAENVYWSDGVGSVVWSESKNANVELNDRWPSKFIRFPDGSPEKPKGLAVKYPIGNSVCASLRRASQTVPLLSEQIQANLEVRTENCKHGVLQNGVCQCVGTYTGDKCDRRDCALCETGRCDMYESDFCPKPLTELPTEVTPTAKATPERIEKSTTEDQPGNMIKVSPSGIEDFEFKLSATEKDMTTNQSTERLSMARTKDNYGTSDGLFVEHRSGEEWKDYVIMALGAICGVLSIVVAVLIMKVIHLKKRPRIRKRIIVNKNVTPMTARPEQCEITIENCCNMNICETPCFEPRSTIRPILTKSKKEEKQTLIDNMEHC